MEHRLLALLPGADRRIVADRQTIHVTDKRLT